MYSPPFGEFCIKPKNNSGGADQTRTDDPLLAKQMLYQLSYNPKTFWTFLAKAHTFYIYHYHLSTKNLYTPNKILTNNHIILKSAR